MFADVWSITIDCLKISLIFEKKKLQSDLILLFNIL